MYKLMSSWRIPALVLLVAFISLFSLSSAFAQNYDEEKDLKAKVQQLQADVDDLTSLLKSLTLQVQKVSDSSNTDLEEFRPRLFSVEKLTKDNTFDIKKMSGTVADLSEKVTELSDLPDQVYQLKDSVTDLKSKTINSIAELSNRIAANELGIQHLQDAVDKAVVLTNNFEQNLGTIFSRLDGSDANINTLHGQIGDLQNSLQKLSTDVDTGYSTLSADINGLNGKVADLQDALTKVDNLAGMVAQFQTQLAEVVARQDQTEAKQAHLSDTVDKLGDIQGQLEQLNAQLLVAARNVQENSQQIQDNTARLDELQAQFGGKSGSASQDVQSQLDRLTQKVGDILAQFNSTQQSVTDMQQQIASAKDEIKRDVLSSIPRVPTTDEITVLIQQTTAKQVKEAQARADAAQGLAIVALMTGLAAVAVALLR
ncbi:hypothetical protein HY229_02200 [Candidatus Acetothermia bacterium]|nr:hypothetical protein [Candidatus Acetothermia bacterium]MBI3642900.1 hypothetical protein [Candidatus Acetothermia bacterium]